MWSQILVAATLVVLTVSSPVPQQAPASTQPQQFSQQQLLAYLQQQQQAQLTQQQPQTFQAAQPQPQRQQYIQQAPQPIQAQQYQQQPQPQLLGVAYSSAGDVSKTSFNGYGISYNF